MKKLTLFLTALMVAVGAMADIPEDAIIIAATSPSARAHGKYMAVTAEGRLITTNTINENALWQRGLNDEWEETISNVGVKGYLYEGTATRQITLSSTAKAVYVMESTVVPGAYGITTDADADPADMTSIHFLNALNQDTDGETGGIGRWFLDAGSSFFFLAYDPEETEEQISAKVDEMYNVSMQKVNAINEVKKWVEASWTGRQMADAAYINIENATTAEEISQAIDAAKQNAIKWAERSLSENATIFNVRTQQPLTYTGSETAPIERTAQPSAQSLWTAEFVEGDPIEADGFSFASFYLRNVVTGKYIAKSTTNYVLGAVDTKEEAGTMNLVMGNTGFEIIVNNNGAADQYLNVSNNGNDTKLTIWAQANDAGAFFEFNELPLFENKVLPIVKGVGELDEDGFAFKQISAIELCVPVGATATGIGAVEMVVFNEDWTTSVVNKWTSEAIAAMTPETKTIEYNYFDEQFNYVTGTVEADVYTLATRNYITDPGNYSVSVSPYAFALTVEDVTTFSPAASGSMSINAPAAAAELIVTPEAGKVESITEIAIDPDGIGEWGIGENVGNITVTFNDRLATAADGTVLDLDGDAMANYDALDWETWEGGGWKIPVNFTAEGKYVMTIPEGFFQNMQNAVNEEMVIEWTIGDLSGIKEITSMKINGKAYDLNGREVANPGRGLYIINGQKVIK